MVILAVGLYPFDPLPPNGAALGGTGLVFRSRGTAWAMLAGAPRSGLAIAAVIEPHEVRGRGRILTINDGEGHLLLGLSQWQDGLVVESPFTAGGFGALGAFRPGEERVVLTVLGPGGISVYLDGRVAASARGSSTAGMAAALLTLGSAPDGRNPWSGRLSFLALLEGGLEGADIASMTDRLKSGPPFPPGTIAVYRFAEPSGRLARNSASDSMHMSVPEAFRPPVRRFLASPLEEITQSRYDIPDAFINLLGFVPFGFASALFARGRRSALFALAAGFFLSLVIELTQGFLPGRHSSSSDLVLNTLGAFAGAGLYRLAALFSRSSPSRSSGTASAP